MFIVTQMVHNTAGLHEAPTWLPPPHPHHQQYNSWGGTIVQVTDKAFSLDRSGHLSQGDSKETSLSTNGSRKVLGSLSFPLALAFKGTECF